MGLGPAQASRFAQGQEAGSCESQNVNLGQFFRSGSPEGLGPGELHYPGPSSRSGGQCSLTVYSTCQTPAEHLVGKATVPQEGGDGDNYL